MKARVTSRPYLFEQISQVKVQPLWNLTHMNCFLTTLHLQQHFISTDFFTFVHNSKVKKVIQRFDVKGFTDDL